MVIIPKEKPVVQNLNSYYLDIKRLIEHYQGELGTGGIHFRSVSVEAAVFFDEDGIVNVSYRDQDSFLEGIPARNQLIKILKNNNFSVSIYRIDADKIFFWANAFNSKEVNRDLLPEFKDLETLIKKMASEKFTGYIDVSIKGQKEKGIIFLNNGAIIGVDCAWDKKARIDPKKNIEHLILESNKSGFSFNVMAIDLNNVQTSSPQPSTPSRLLDMIHELLVTFEMLVGKNKKIKIDFSTLLKKKFVEKADRYDFLDPFTDEFAYNRDSVEFTGKASPEQLVNGVIESVTELAKDLEMLDSLRKNLENWVKHYTNEVIRFGIKL